MNRLQRFGSVGDAQPNHIGNAFVQRSGGLGVESLGHDDRRWDSWLYLNRQIDIGLTTGFKAVYRLLLLSSAPLSAQAISYTVLTKIQRYGLTILG
ncbi:MAG: hypothetical protein NZ772_10150 [Cyanobacteria bacterium]|nr:hypothetical protein [Cyanobacteriota bacterium]MDW8201358.1 hypothetical protein [Cyanobacteriota bacterium SKYGB_h_bin112]